MQDNILKDFFNRRKISDSVISEFNVHWGKNQILGECIVIPIDDEQGDFSFNKYRRNPLSADTPKYVYDKGGRTTLYGFSRIDKKKREVLWVEGEFDALVAWSSNIQAVSSTGGALSMKDEWKDLLEDFDVVLCFDNDEAGGEGMAKALTLIPTARVLFLPDRPGIKDISDYVGNGGNLDAFIKTAVRFTSLEQIIEDKTSRESVWKSTFFHDAYIKMHTKPTYVKQERDSKTEDRILRAKEYPISDLITFDYAGKAKCPFHNEKTASLHYYADKNKTWCFGGCGRGFDAIDIYRKIYNCSFQEAVNKLQ